jgi:hypothetical protein
MAWPVLVELNERAGSCRIRPMAHPFDHIGNRCTPLVAPCLVVTNSRTWKRHLLVDLPDGPASVDSRPLLELAV